MKRFLKSLFFVMMPVVPFAAHGTDAKKDPTAVIKTSMGDITVELFAERTPETVKNFIGLSDGSKEWKGQKKKGEPLYNGTVFHRVISGFMIQGGDPDGNGMGGPGYRFKDEFKSDDKFDGEGYLAMANAGPGTNGSQFFITLAPTPHLKGRHTIFGKVTKGLEVLRKIGEVPTGAADRPKTPVTIQSIEVSTSKSDSSKKESTEKAKG